jgi:hypothetical protein
MDKWTNGDLSNTEALRRTYINHYAYIRSKVPPEKLLNFHPRDGWEPLCDFLGKEVPRDEAFPRVNDSNCGYPAVAYWAEVSGHGCCGRYCVFACALVKEVDWTVVVSDGWVYHRFPWNRVALSALWT